MAKAERNAVIVFEFDVMISVPILQSSYDTRHCISFQLLGQIL